MSLRNYRKIINTRVLTEEQSDYLLDQILFASNTTTGTLYSEIARLNKDMKDLPPELKILTNEVIQEKHDRRLKLTSERHLPILNYY
jgi:hypothetical protein